MTRSYPSLLFAVFCSLFAFLLLPLLSYAADSTNTSAAPDAAGPPSGAAYQFQRQGIFDCNQNGAYALSVGALSAIGGAYVPVADATVELNTGILVYKECILREVVDRESESAGTALAKQMSVTILSGRNGNPYFVQKPDAEMVLYGSDPAVLADLKGAMYQKINPAFRADAQRTVARIYETETRSPQNILACPVKGDIIALETARPGSFNWQDFRSAANPACYSLGVAGLAQTLTSGDIGRAYGNLSQQWLFGRGFYPRTDASGVIVTPASVIQSSYQTQLDSPVHRLENANDIGQMIGALYAGINAQIVGDSRGLAGLTQSIGSQPSYLDRVAKESATGLQNAANNAALVTLNAWQQIESSYYQAANAIGASLLQSKQQLQTAETQCWAAVIPKVCATPLKSDGTCTAQASCAPDPNDPQGPPVCSNGITLRVATSTAFSSAVIDSQITPFTSAAAENIEASKNSLQLISNLIQGITNTTSLDAQRVALEQLDALVGQHKLHSQTDLTNIVQQQSAVADKMGTLLQKIAQTWSGTGSDGTGNFPWDGTVNPGNGWCNYNNSATAASWTQKWTR